MESEHSGDADSRSQHSSSPSAISSHRSTPRSFSSPPPANSSSSPPPVPNSSSSIFPGFSGLNKCTPGGYPTLPHSMYPMLPFSLPSPFSLPMPLPFSAFVSASGKSTMTTEAVSSAICTTASSSSTLDNSTEVSAISSVTPSERGTEMSKAKNAIPGLNCVVCGDTSSGKHYGILACNGCSGFFKRSVRRRLLYRCQTGTGNCVIDKAHRNQCQACRLKKCLQFGMNRDAVQNERQPRNSATLRPEVLAEMDQERFLREAVTAVGAFGPPVSLAMSLVSSAVQLQHNKAEEQREREAAHLTAVKMEVPETERKPNSPQNASSQHLVNLSSAPFLYADPNNYNSASALSSENVYETSARLLFMAVKWAKNLPSFAGLPFRDQVILLEESWAEIFLLCTLQWSMHLDSAPLFMASSHSALPNNNNNSPTHGQSRNGSKCASPTSLSNNNLVSDLRFLSDLSQRFKNLSVDAAEFACMKAVVLFRQVRGLKDPAQVENLQDQAQVMLSQHCRLQWPHQPAKFGKLLLLLPLLRHVPSLRMEHLYFRQTIGTTPMEKVLADMYRH